MKRMTNGLSEKQEFDMFISLLAELTVKYWRDQQANPVQPTSPESEQPVKEVRKPKAKKQAKGPQLPN